MSPQQRKYSTELLKLISTFSVKIQVMMLYEGTWTCLSFLKTFHSDVSPQLTGGESQEFKLLMGSSSRHSNTSVCIYCKGRVNQFLVILTFWILTGFPEQSRCSFLSHDQTSEIQSCRSCRLSPRRPSGPRVPAAARPGLRSAGERETIS